MKKELHLNLGKDIIREYNEKGASVLRQCVNQKWIEKLRKAIEKDISNPGPFVHCYKAENGAGAFHGNLRTWENDLSLKSFCFESALPELASKLMESKYINLFYDQLFIKEPETLNRTRWHNDQPYWPIRGWKVMSFWIALDPVDNSRGALEFISGSHRWNRWFQPEAFGDTERKNTYEINPNYEPIPDIESARGDYNIISWELEPGDVYIFHGLTVHGSGGNRSNNIRRRGYAVRYTGDDVVYDTRKGTNEHLCSKIHKNGALLNSEQYPNVFSIN